MEMLVLTWGIDCLRKRLPRFMRPERRHVALPMRLARARVEYQPLWGSWTHCRSAAQQQF